MTAADRKALDLADQWEELLALPERTDAQDARDFDDLHQAARDLVAGQLGDPPAAELTLDTLAHQIGRRQPPARRPVGLFLTEGVGPLRRARRMSCQRNHLARRRPR